MSDTAVFNYVAIINAYPERQRHDLARVHEKVRELSRDHGWPEPFYREARTAVDILKAVQELRDRAKESGLIPVLQIEGHGSTHGMVRLGTTAQDTSERADLDWPILSRALGELNALARNTMVVVMCTCRGIESARSIGLNRAAPFSVLVAAEGDSYSTDLLWSLPRFYQAMMVDRDIERALEAVYPYLKLLSVEVMLKKAAVGAVRDTLGRERSKRLGKIVRPLVRAGVQVSKDDLNASARRHFTVSTAKLESWFDTVMCGRPVSFSAADVRDEVRAQARQRRRGRPRRSRT